jgi:hypothetical protein
MFRLTLQNNGATRKEVASFDSSSGLAGLMDLASKELDFGAKRAFNKHGANIKNVALIRDEDVVTFSAGEDFLQEGKEGIIPTTQFLPIQ